MIRIDDLSGGGVEFTPDLVRLVWANYQLKERYKEAIEIEVGWRVYLPEELSRLFCTRYVWEGDIVRRKAFAGARLLGDLKNKFYHRMDIRNIANDFGIGCKYVCFIPSLSERWLENNKIGNPAGGRSVPFLDWIKYKQIANERGYKVVSIGILDETGMDKVESRMLGDYHLYIEKKDREVLEGATYRRFWNGEIVNWQYCLWDQLQLMAGAEFTLGMGGGGLIAPVFGLPCISVDEFYWNHFGDYGLKYDDFDILWDFDQYRTKEDGPKEEFAMRKIVKTQKYVEEVLTRRLI